MPEPQGNLVSPVGLNAAGLPRTGNLPFTYKSVLQQSNVLAAVGAGWENWNGAAVPAGEIWVLTHAAVLNETSGVTNLIIAVTDGIAYYHLKGAAVTAANVTLDWQGWLIMVEGDYVEGWKGGGVAADSLLLIVRGFIMGL